MPIRHLPFTAVLFDIDNTLMNTEDFYDQGVYHVYNLYIKRTFPTIQAAQFYKAYQLGRLYTRSNLKNTGSAHNRLLYFEKAFEILGLPSDLNLLFKIHNSYWDFVINNARLYPQMYELLVTLEKAHIRTAVITDSINTIQIKKLLAKKLNYLVDIVVTSEEAGRDKPAISQFLYAMHKLEAIPAETIVIGNNPDTDIKGGFNAGLTTILFDYNKKYDTTKLEIRPTYYVNTVNPIFNILGLSNFKCKTDKFVIVLDTSLFLHPWKKYVSQFLANLNIKNLYIEVLIKQLAYGYLNETNLWNKLNLPPKQSRQLVIKLLNKYLDNKLVDVLNTINTHLNNFSKKYHFIIYTDLPTTWFKELFSNLPNNVHIVNTSDYIGIPKNSVEGYYLLIKDFAYIPVKNYVFVSRDLNALRPLRFWEEQTKIWIQDNSISYNLQEDNQNTLPNAVPTHILQEFTPESLAKLLQDILKQKLMG